MRCKSQSMCVCHTHMRRLLPRTRTSWAPLDWALCMSLVAFVFATQWCSKERLAHVAFWAIGAAYALLLRLARPRTAHAAMLLVLLVIVAIAIGPVHGRICADQTYDVFVTTVRRNEKRLWALDTLLGRVDIEAYRYYGFDGYTATLAQIAAHFNETAVVGRYREDQKGVLAIFLANRDFFSTAHQGFANDWVVMLEDDANVGRLFRERLERALCASAGQELVWLDTRNAANWFFFGRLDGGITGLALRRAALPKVVRYMQLDSPDFVAALQTQDYARRIISDAFLARLCNERKLACTYAGLVMETCVATTH
jgi:hypothetical protein